MFKIQDIPLLSVLENTPYPPTSTMTADNHEERFTYENFLKCIQQITQISNDIHDGWQLHHKEKNLSPELVYELQHIPPGGKMKCRAITIHSVLGLDNSYYITKKSSQVLEKSSCEGAKLIVVFEYHIAYNINYGVPVLCFVAWKQDGSLLQIEEYCEFNKNFSNTNVLSTLTQLDHPVLCKPFLTLHPCRTREIMDTFLSKSKNPVVSWMSVISPFLNLTLREEYIRVC